MEIEVRLITLMLVGVLAAQNSSTFNAVDLSRQPEAIIPFQLSYKDFRDKIYISYVGGMINVEFDIDEEGNVINPIIIDTFNVSLNDVVLDKVRQSKYYPATQNGVPVKVKYSLPIKFK